MRRNHRSIAAALAAVAGTLAWAGTAGAQDDADQQQASQDKGEIYYLIPTLLDEFQSTSQKAIERVFGDLGYTVTSLSADNRSERQLNQCDNAVATDPAAIILNAVDFDAAGPCVDKAHENDIPVMVYDRVIKSKDIEFTSMAGTVEMGRTAAHQAVRLLKKKNGSAEGHVLQIMGDPGDAYTLDIRKGFDEVMSDQPDIEVTTKAAKRWEAARAGRIAENQLLANQDYDLIFVHAAHLAVSVSSVIEAQGYDKGEIKLISSNGAPVGLDLIRDGWEQVEVEQPLYAQVWALAKFAPMIIAGETPEPGSYDILGTDSKLVDEKWGPTIRIPGTAITEKTVDETRFWGNLEPPDKPVQPVSAED